MNFRLKKNQGRKIKEFKKKKKNIEHFLLCYIFMLHFMLHFVLHFMLHFMLHFKVDNSTVEAGRVRSHNSRKRKKKKFLLFFCREILFPRNPNFFARAQKAILK